MANNNNIGTSLNFVLVKPDIFNVFQFGRSTTNNNKIILSRCIQEMIYLENYSIHFYYKTGFFDVKLHLLQKK